MSSSRSWSSLLFVLQRWQGKSAFWRTWLSTGVRRKASLLPTTSTLVATDHDLHKKGSLTPSVYFKCENPDTIDHSFYRDQVTTVNDSVFQSSNPMRFAAAMVQLIRGDPANVNTIVKCTDGGTDHRNTLENVKCAANCIIKKTGPWHVHSCPVCTRLELN